MRQRVIYFGILLSIIFIFTGQAQQSDFPDLRGPYLGQKSPGKTAEFLSQDIASPDGWKHHGSLFIPWLSLTQDKNIEYQVMTTSFFLLIKMRNRD